MPQKLALYKLVLGGLEKLDESNNGSFKINRLVLEKIHLVLVPLGNC